MIDDEIELALEEVRRGDMQISPEILTDPRDERIPLLLATRLAVAGGFELRGVDDPEIVRALRSAARKAGKLLGQRVYTQARSGFVAAVKPEDRTPLQQAMSEYVPYERPSPSPMRRELPKRNPNLISLTETAVSLGCSTRTVQRLMANGELGSSRVGREVYLRRDEVAAYLQAMWREPVWNKPRVKRASARSAAKGKSS